MSATNSEGAPASGLSKAALVLIDRPEYLNIPYFEMADPSSRENRFARLSLNALPNTKSH